MTITHRFGNRDHSDLGTRDHLKGVSGGDIGMAQATGMDAEDVEAIRLVCYNAQLLLTIRCPRVNTRHFVTKLAPKPMGAKGKSDADGAGGSGGDRWASDYDLMGVFITAGAPPGSRYARIVTTKPPVPGRKPEMTDEFKVIFAMLNARMRHPFQHGANDDYRDASGKVFVDSKDLWGARYVAFTETGWARFIPSFGHLHRFYVENGLDWPYGTERPKFTRQPG